ncbi:MAG: MGMT family protein [Phycisphaerales bacterium]|nr:MGMT family protein [Phycisphaerales bacterium]
MAHHMMNLAGATVIVEHQRGCARTRYRKGRTRASPTKPPAEVMDAAALIGDFISGRAISAAAITRMLPTVPPFHAACWRASLAIPRGQTRTYQWLAAAAGRPKAHRAAAAAMAKNPLAPLVPCHRVVSANGLGGFCGAMAKPSERSPTHWALAMKLRMLESERVPKAPRKAHRVR